jgi:hypothetical protein
VKIIQEVDWKYMSRLKPVLLERLCNRILDQIQADCRPEKRSTGSHEQYLLVFKLVADQDKIIADCFDGWSRNKLLEKIAYLSRHKVITPDELLGLSEETRDILRLLAGI